MTKIIIPKLKFSKWIPIEDYYISDSGYRYYPGVYLISLKKISSTISSPAAIITDKDIVYIGMSTTGVRHRLRKHYSNLQSGISNQGMSSRLLKMYGKYTSKKGWNGKRLYVSFTTPFGKINGRDKNPKDLKKMGIITYLEYHCLYLWYNKFGRLPEGNGGRKGFSKG